MIAKLLISLGLILTPFVLAKGYDVRTPKMAVALGVALAIGLSGVFFGQLKAFKNRWLLIFLGYLFFNYKFLPRIAINNGFINGWVWQCYTYIAVFFLMLLVISSIQFTRQELIASMNIILWCGIIMSLYVVLQYFRLDSFFKSTGNPENYFIHNFRVAGTLGHPTVVAPFFAILFPFALYMRKKIALVLFSIALALTGSMVAIGATVISVLAYLFIKSRKSLTIALILAVLFLGGLGIAGIIEPSNIRDSGRITQWKSIVSEVVNPIEGNNFSLVGLGLGSFPYFYKTRHDTVFAQAHNEYIELMYCSGIIGLFLFLASIWQVFKNAFKANEIARPFYCSFLVMVLCACGLFIWQIAPYNFYAVFILGILHNQEVMYGS